MRHALFAPETPKWRPGDDTMAWLRLVKKSQALVANGALYIGLPFLRMMILSRALNLRELGFASALASTYSIFELITDIAIYRFVYSSSREEFAQACAASHALSIVRGLFVALLAFACAPLVAAAFSLEASWKDFAILGVITLIRSFEHLEPKVAERDFNFRPQLIIGLVSTVTCLLALGGALAIRRDHVALTVSLFGQAAGLVLASQIVARAPYRLAFRSEYFVKAFKFGYPLMFNGIGLALSAQGDRFLVGSLLGLPALGTYSVVMLAVLLPISMISRIAGSLVSATLFNSSGILEKSVARLRLFARGSSVIASLYAVGVVTFGNIVVPLVFGPKFHVSKLGLSLLAFAAFLRIVRDEPFTSILLLAQRTKRVAIGNLSGILALCFGAALMTLYANVESAVAGRALGEAIGFLLSFFLCRKLITGAERDLGLSILAGLLFVAVACSVDFIAPVGAKIAPSLIAFAVYGAILLLWGARAVRPLLAAATTIEDPQARLSPQNAMPPIEEAS